MAGGYGRGAGIPLEDRVRVGSSEEPTTASVTAGSGQPARHCWITVPADGAASRPCLLLEWRQDDLHWEGRVVYAAELRPGRWATVEEWVPAELLSPAR
jgi:hypothetical protein